MSSTSFEAFSRDFCAALGLAPPEVQASADTPAAFSIDYRDVALVLAEAGTSHMPQVSLLVDFGDVPEHEQAEVYPALLQANFLMLEGGAPSFSLHPLTGRVTYQFTFSLEQADPQALREALDGIADAVLQWRETRCLPEAVGHVREPHTPAHSMRA
jgi:hypothetical protein